MRRKDRAVTELGEILDIMEKCQAVSVAFSGETPYVIPMSYGFDCVDDRVCLYLHCACEGEKLTRFAADPRAAFTMYTDMQITTASVACGYSTTYASVCGSGALTALRGEEKRHGLERIMAHYAPGRHFTFEEKALAAVTVLRLDARQLSGKRHAAI